MALTLTQMRDRVRQYVDDVAARRYDIELSTAAASNPQIDGALTTAGAAAFSLVAQSGSGRFRTTGVFTASSAGVVDLSAVKPSRIYAVRLTSGAAPYQTFGEVLPVRGTSYGALHPAAEVLTITYVPSSIFPVAPGSTFTWGSVGTDVPELDDLTCLMAASSLKVIEGEDNPALERRKKEARDEVLRLPDLTSWAVHEPCSTSRFGRPGLFYVSLEAHRLQLVER